MVVFPTATRAQHLLALVIDISRLNWLGWLLDISMDMKMVVFESVWTQKIVKRVSSDLENAKNVVQRIYIK